MELRARGTAGFRIRLFPDLGDFNGLISGRDIAIADRGCPRWHRFIIAHELAHAIDDEHRIVSPRGTTFYEHCLDAAAAMAIADINALIHLGWTAGNCLPRFVCQLF